MKQNEMFKTWGERLKAARLKADLERSHLACALRVSEQTVWRWETGKASPNDQNKLALAKVLKIKPSKIWNLDTQAKSA